MNQGRQGWLRAWVLAAAIWLICCVAYTVSEFPTEDQIRRHYTDSMYKNRPKPTRRDEITALCHSNEDFLHCMTVNLDRLKDAVELDRSDIERYRLNDEAALEALVPDTQIKAVVRGLVAWIAPTLAAPALFLALAWVRRGFKKQETGGGNSIS